MPETYKVTLRIVVTKSATGDIIVEEEFYFPDVIFSRMTNVADEFYELIEKLQKKK